MGGGKRAAYPTTDGPKALAHVQVVSSWWWWADVGWAVSVGRLVCFLSHAQHRQGDGEEGFG